jgi:hypothetical protein
MADEPDFETIEGSDDTIMRQLLSFAGIDEEDYPDFDFGNLSMDDVLSAAMGFDVFDDFFWDDFDADRPGASDRWHRFITRDPEKAAVRLREELRRLFEGGTDP